MKETQLIKAAIQGDKDAFCELYDLFRMRLYRYAYYRLGNQDDAEDAVSSCVLSAWEQIRKLRDPEAFPAWIFRILHGTCSSIIRDMIKTKGDQPIDDLAYEISDDHEGPDTRAELMEALGKVPEDTREMILLSVVGGLTGKEIGDIYDMPQGTVRSRLSRGLAAMREVLEEEND